MPVTTLDDNSALLIVDLQKGISNHPLVHSLPDIVARANELAAAFRARNLPVVMIAVNGAPPGRTQAGRPRPKLSDDFADLLPDLARSAADLHILKQAPSAFANTGLQDCLLQLGVTQVVVLGVATGSGVDSTARHAYELGFSVTLVDDAMTDVDVGRHENCLTSVFPRVGEVGSTREILALLP